MKFVPNPAFIPAFLSSQDAKDIVQPTVEEIVDVVKADAPVEEGRYRDSVHAEEGRVVADDEASLYIEYGTVDTPAFAPLRRGAEQVVGTDKVGR